MDNVNPYQYGQGDGMNTQKNQSKALAIVGLVLSILSFIFCLCYCAALPLGIAGIIISIIVLAGKKSGKGMAIASMILSGLAVIISVVTIAVAGSLSDNVVEFYADLPEIVEDYKEDGSVPDYLEEYKEQYPEYFDAFMEGVIEEYDKDPEKYNEAAEQFRQMMEENQ